MWRDRHQGVWPAALSDLLKASEGEEPLLTAADIAELRMLSKGNVSQGVESLIQNGYLERFPDLSDRRRIHLSLTAQSGDIIYRIDEAKARSASSRVSNDLNRAPS